MICDNKLRGRGDSRFGGFNWYWLLVWNMCVSLVVANFSY
jgi:hypothetical protein